MTHPPPPPETNPPCKQKGPPLARVVGLSKAFGAKRILQNVSVDFFPGCFTFVVGPSGTGKSVLVKHLVGLLEPDQGEVYYRDERVDQLPEERLYELRKRCVYVFQHPTLFDSMSVLENVSVVLRYHGKIAKALADEQALVQLRFLGVEEFAQRMPGQLSASQQKRISIARALALHPETLILDEPTTGLDPFAAQELNDTMATLSRQGMNLMCISHDIQSIRQLAHQVVFLLRGSVRFSGPASGFFASNDSAVQQFISGDVDGDI